MKRMNPQVEIKINSYVHTPGLQEWSTMVKTKVQTFLESINKPFYEKEFAEAFHKGAYGQLTLSGIDFKIRQQ